ncbi:carbamoyltransferase HypF [Mesorhizobium sp. VK25A]|uniref:Carbamoyltransferase HypF n=1 Tax=Mesorhizobium vachelliae TaxID=3072309 RepID=A0ABU5A5Y4_9HYPH|nr:MULTISPECIES: carbamoyltransferase HypF [unclassified Mesorhizobium]MDX8533118.1 carbamoyltransferase HypF [Mesorhizobium sp. VK25D]MDX8545037.1 carbamoyltransferase HypF [Mesorhizobium sp. VK25A]
MTAILARETENLRDSVQIRVRGRVQGVGFRPTVWRFAQESRLHGEVLNDGEGVLIRVRGPRSDIQRLVERLRSEPPPLASIEAIELAPFIGQLDAGFRIVESATGEAHTEISPDAGICAACAAEVLDPFARRYRYPFTNCTHCGPRLTIVRGIPYDRASTTMAPFPLCVDCAAEYGEPADRRFHAEPIACHACGPKARLVRFDGRAVSYEQHSMLDDVDAAMSLIQKGEIVAIKALGGYQLACDATRPEAVARLRQLKRRDGKPFALMARDIDVIRKYCAVSREEEQALRSAAAPIVLLDASGPQHLPESVAPGMSTLGFMLPSTPLHVLLFRRMARPVVMTSGNLSDEPQVTDDAEAAAKLGQIASFALTHNREIANRVDDSVVRLAVGKIRMLRRARGHAPASVRLPRGFETAPQILAFGPEMKATFCLVKDGRAVLSQHQGDLEDAATFDDYCKNLVLFRELFGHQPRALACDMHPEYLSSKLARERAQVRQLALIEVQHHHAHIAACLAENGRPLGAPAVLGIALDGLGFGPSGETGGGAIWGGEFLLADYRDFDRLGTFKPVAMPGGAQASREPWRNLYAHLMAELGWAQLAMNFSELEIFRALARKPRATLDGMIKDSLNSPPASSCGRLFDAVAAALGICFERQAYEGEAAMRLEAIVCRKTMAEEGDELAYPLAIPNLKGTGIPYVEPVAMWNAILGDLVLQTPVEVMAARFHKGLANVLVAMALKLARRDDEAGPRFDTIALSGGCFNNRILLEQTARRLEEREFNVLTHAEVPAGDGGVALGQAAIAAAHCIDAATAR